MNVNAQGWLVAESKQGQMNKRGKKKKKKKVAYV
jgi:hypothetical protein